MKNHEAFFEEAKNVLVLLDECRTSGDEIRWRQVNNPYTLLIPNVEVVFLTEHKVEIISQNTLFDLYDYPGDAIEDAKVHLSMLMREVYPQYGTRYMVRRDDTNLHALCSGPFTRRKELLFTVSFENGTIKTRFASLSIYDIALVLAWYDDMQHTED